MSNDQIAASLQQVALFHELTPAQLAEIAGHAERVKFHPGDLITMAGEPGAGAYLLVSGAAETLPGPGSRLPAQRIEEGSLIGELAMLVDYDYGTTTVACERVLCLRITRAAMHGQMLRDPALARHLTQRLRDRMARIAHDLHHIEQTFSEPKRPAAAGRDAPPAPPPALPFRALRAPRLSA